ncbi:MAG TPA: hypothetical protein VL137_17150 [Polyangiaceae bacterium]|nr:hypothetical protein [Polyangiaceae bacterium]
MHAWLQPESRPRRLLIGLGVYFIVTAVMLACAARSVLREHTPYNHFALQAQAWLHGHLDLGGDPPAYAGNNDFAKFENKWFVTFPCFPALLLVPLVRYAGSAEGVRDGQFFIWLSGVGPAVLFLALEKMRRAGRSLGSEESNLLLCLLFAFGTVYFFTAVQGTVWFAAHVVAVALCALYLLFALDAERPFLAGLMLAFAFWTRTPLLFAFPLLALEALRVHSKSQQEHDAERSAGFLQRKMAQLKSVFGRIDWPGLFKTYVLFALPLALGVGLACWYNVVRFKHPFDYGYQYLTIVWQGRMQKWGLFHYHYLGKNLGVVLTSLPWLGGGGVPFRINMHGLALWFTTPCYLLLLWPKDTRAPHWALWCTIAAVAVPTLFYQNTGWEQFGYRFSNDYSIFLFALLALGGFPALLPRAAGAPSRFWPRAAFTLLGIWAIGVNTFGALTFQRDGMQKYYYSQGTQKSIYEE